MPYSSKSSLYGSETAAPHLGYVVPVPAIDAGAARLAAITAVVTDVSSPHAEREHNSLRIPSSLVVLPEVSGESAGQGSAWTSGHGPSCPPCAADVEEMLRNP